MIIGKNISFSYKNEEKNILAVDNVSFSVGDGELVAVLGHNGSGKSTLAKLINGLGLPDDGDIVVFGKNTRSDDLWEIRKSCGMVFQNPDSQIVASIVAEDIAFGLENTGVETEKMEGIIDDALEIVGMSGFKEHSTQNLSGGQKQKIAIAGIFAMKPKCIILDEATAMLDPVGRESVLKTVLHLRERFGISVIMITHFIDEAALCDKVYVMNDGKIVMEGKTRDVLTRGEELVKIGLEEPFYVELAERLGLKKRLYTTEEFAKAALPFVKKEKSVITKNEKKSNTVLSVKGVYYKYDREPVIKNISFDVKEGSFTVIMGHTGSGKSTLLRNLNGLYKAQRGEILFKGKNIGEYDDICSKIGIVFQNPDNQLFEETVLKEVMFGGLNIGMSLAEAEENAKSALDAVGFSMEKIEKSPFELSGGEKKRVTIAAALIMKPEILVLDEPCAGLDPQGRRDIKNCIKKIRQERDLSVIMVTHSMEDAAELGEHIVVLSKGEIIIDGKPRDVFMRGELLKEAGLGVPRAAELKNRLIELGADIDQDAYRVEEYLNFGKDKSLTLLRNERNLK